MLRGTLLLLAIAAPFPLQARQADPGKPGWKARLETHSATPEAWAARRKEIREKILVAAGLWPEFERPALAPRVFGKVEGDGFTVERVVLETLPGLHLTGSLYRPVGKKGPFPAVLSPHGHWRDGRFTQEKDGNLPGRGLTFARLGFVCFFYDMVGYADFKQLPHQFSDPASGVGLLGLQLWNSIRALDFLASLEDVDPKRLGCSGASGGGTQTFLLSAVDDRIACAAPVNMVAAEFQGGCSCENAPTLRIGLNNVEIAAATAPRPLLLIAATGDWTRNVPTLEGPAIQEVYKNLGAAERFRAVRFEAPHNYNQDSREAVYAWFVRWLQQGADRERLAEPPLPVVKREDLSVFTAEFKLPEGAADAAGVARGLREKVQAQLEALRPRDAESLARFRAAMLPALRHSLGVEPPRAADVETVVDSLESKQRRTFLRLRGTTTPLELLAAHPAVKPVQGRVLLVAVPADGESDPVAQEFARRKELVVLLPLRPHRGEPASGGNLDQRTAYGTTFFRTALGWQVQDILTATAVLADRRDISEILIVGTGSAGPAALLARPLAGTEKVSGAAADLSGLEAGLLARIGGARTAAILAASGRLVLQNVPTGFDVDPVRAAFRAAGREEAFQVAPGLDRILESGR